MTNIIQEGFSQQEILRYSRHLMLPEVGLAGQVKLKNASVLIVGTGGLGSAIGTYLAAAGVGRIGLVDFDTVDISNLQRQILHSTGSVGDPKVVSACRRLLEINPEIHIEPYLTSFNTDNAEDIAQDYEILIDGTDNLQTRYLLNDLAVKTHKPFVYGSIHRFEGQASVFISGQGPCYRCIFPQPPALESGALYYEGGVLGILPGTIGTIQATEVIKLILGIGEPLIGKLLIYDALEMSFQTIQIQRNRHCPVCGEDVKFVSLIDYDAFCGTQPERKNRYGLSPEKMISAGELSDLLSKEKNLILVDVREAVELEISKIPGAIHVPIYEIEEWASRTEKDTEIVLFCRSGNRSARAVLMLDKLGLKRVRNFEGGINAWSAEVDSSVAQY